MLNHTLNIEHISCWKLGSLLDLTTIDALRAFQIYVQV